MIVRVSLKWRNQNTLGILRGYHPTLGILRGFKWWCLWEIWVCLLFSIKGGVEGRCWVVAIVVVMVVSKGRNVGDIRDVRSRWATHTNHKYIRDTFNFNAIQLKDHLFNKKRHGSKWKNSFRNKIHNLRL